MTCLVFHDAGSKPGHVLCVAVQLQSIEGKVHCSSVIRVEDEVSGFIVFSLILMFPKANTAGSIAQAGLNYRVGLAIGSTGKNPA